MAKYLPLSGFNVTVLTGNNQAQDIIINENIISIKDINHESKTIFDYSWRAIQKILRAIGFYRGVHAFWLAKTLANSEKIINLVKPEIILASYPCIEAVEIGLKLSKEYNLPLVIDFRDGLLFEPLEAGMLKKGSFQSHYRDVESQVAKNASLIISISQPITSYFMENYGCTNLFTLPNGFDEEDKVEFIKYHWHKDVIHIVHTGRISSSREGDSISNLGVSSLSAALTILDKQSPELLSKIKIHFVGKLDSKERAALSIFVKQGLVILWGQQPRSIALGFQRMADYLLLITSTDQASLATGKIFEYLAANKYILALTRGTEAEKIVVETGSGVVMPPDDPLEIAENLRFLLGGGRLNVVRNHLSINAYSRVSQMRSLAAYLRKLGV
jgi:glycosyltransferase involved in cell wall biosynthesis